MRSFRLPVGPYHSSFRKPSGLTSAVTRFRRTSGVRPTPSAIDVSAVRNPSQRTGMAPDCTRVGSAGPAGGVARGLRSWRDGAPGGWRGTPARSAPGADRTGTRVNLYPTALEGSSASLYGLEATT